MSDSILNVTKKALGIDPEYSAFDLDIITFINSTFSTLTQLGVGPDEGFSIEDDTAVWSDFLGTDKRQNTVKTYMILKVRMLFDPPQTSFLINALNEQVKELEWRINVVRENDEWVDPIALDDINELEIVVDGGRI